MAIAEILAAQKQIITIAILIHGRTIVATGTLAILMETNIVNIAIHQQQIATEKDLMTVALMRVAAETAPVHLAVLIE